MTKDHPVVYSSGLFYLPVLALSALQFLISSQQRLVGRQCFQVGIDGEQAIEALLAGNGGACGATASCPYMRTNAS